MRTSLSDMGITRTSRRGKHGTEIVYLDTEGREVDIPYNRSEMSDKYYRWILEVGTAVVDDLISQHEVNRCFNNQYERILIKVMYRDGENE